jgi:hypothetical protein
MVERSRSGAYIPVGKVYRSQLEATSPWSFAEKAKRLHAEDVCPDCAAEQSMKRHDSVKVREDILQAASHFHGHQPAPNPGPPPTTVSDPAPVAAVDMIKDTGTIVVVQHEGILDRLAVDPRRRPLDRASTQRLSENLVKVSKAVAELGSVDEHPAQTNTDLEHLHAGTPEPQPLRPLKIKSCSMSELLDDLHVIAAGMNVDLSGPAKEETFVQAQSHMTRAQSPPTAFYDAEGLLSEPTTTGAMPAELHQNSTEPHYTSGPAPKHSPPHVEDAESLLSEPTSPASAVMQRPSSRVVTSPATTTAPRFAPGHYPMSPAPLSPWSIQSPKPTKRVRTMNRWPPECVTSPPPESPTSESDQAYITTELHKAVQEVAARERDLHKAIKEAAEMERSLRRKVMTRRWMGGTSKE